MKKKKGKENSIQFNKNVILPSNEILNTVGQGETETIWYGLVKIRTPVSLFELVDPKQALETPFADGTKNIKFIPNFWIFEVKL
jgi:hypothetical protein